MEKRQTPSWADRIPEGSFISTAPTYGLGRFLSLFHEDRYSSGEKAPEDGRYANLKYYYYDPTEHGYPKGKDYPLLTFLHGTSNSFVGINCINYCGAELFASPKYQADFRGAYILVPIANEFQGREHVEGSWCTEYIEPLYALINDFIIKHTDGIGNRFLLGNSSGATMTMAMAERYPEFFRALIPVGSSVLPGDSVLKKWDELKIRIFYAIAKRDEFHDFESEVAPILARLNSMKYCTVYNPEWVRNGDRGINSIYAGVEMGQHCLMNAVQANLMFDDGTPMDPGLPRGITGWIDEVNRGGCGRKREYLIEIDTPDAAENGKYCDDGKALTDIDAVVSAGNGKKSGKVAFRTGHLEVGDGISLYYEEYGTGDNVILSAQCGFYHRGMQQRMATLGYHVYCITLRGFHPSSLITENYGDRWYDVFALDVLSFADRLGIKRFSYMGASHGAGVGWHLMLMGQERVDAFVAVVPGPHSLKEGTMSYRQMLEQGIIKCPPPFDPPIDGDDFRQQRRDYRNQWLEDGTKRAFDEEKRLDYGRPMMRFGTEEKLCEALKSITVPVLIIGGYDDPISTPELMMRTAGCLPHCKLLIYGNCGHNIDTDLIEETSEEADKFIANVKKTGRVYRS